MTFLGSFIQYVIVMIMLAALGFLGGFIGKKIRDAVDAKKAAEATPDNGDAAQ